MRLSTFISENMDQILDEWESFAKTLLPAAAGMSRSALRDHSRPILEAIAADIQTAQTGRQRADKSHDCAPTAQGLASPAAVHGGLRHGAGFDVLQLNAEFRALRASVIRLWTTRSEPPPETAFEDMLRFDEAVDQALAESIARYAEEVERSRNMFLAVLGHDLRTPLGAIAMTTQYLNMAGVTEEKRTEALARIDRSTVAMAAMIKDLLEFTRSRLGPGIPVSVSLADVRKICQDAVDDVRMAYPSCDFQLRTDGDLNGMVDTDRLKQVLWNLLNNAVQHGGRAVPIVLEASGDAESLRFTVSNDGPPIGPAALEVIFNPLVRGDDGASPAANLGLGLYIAREIVHAHGGTIVASSSEAEGTVFAVELPRSQA